MKIDKKYVMIVTAEDERYGTAGYGLDFFANSPAEGILNDIVYGDDLDELMVSSDGESNEGLFYLLYRMKKNESGISTGIKIGSGTVDWSAIEWKRKREGKRNDFSRLGRRCKNDCEKFFAERNGEVKCNCCNGYYGSKHE